MEIDPKELNFFVREIFDFDVDSGFIERFRRIDASGGGLLGQGKTSKFLQFVKRFGSQNYFLGWFNPDKLSLSCLAGFGVPKSLVLNPLGFDFMKDLIVFLRNRCCWPKE